MLLKNHREKKQPQVKKQQKKKQKAAQAALLQQQNGSHTSRSYDITRGVLEKLQILCMFLIPFKTLPTYIPRTPQEFRIQSQSNTLDTECSAPHSPAEVAVRTPPSPCCLAVTTSSKQAELKDWRLNPLDSRFGDIRLLDLLQHSRYLWCSWCSCEKVFATKAVASFRRHINFQTHAVPGRLGTWRAPTAAGGAASARHVFSIGHGAHWSLCCYSLVPHRGCKRRQKNAE